MTVKELCQQYDIAPPVLAHRFSIPPRTVQQWYAGDRTPPAYVVSMMEKILDVEKEHCPEASEDILSAE